jgi:hypothetical protein
MSASKYAKTVVTSLFVQKGCTQRMIKLESTLFQLSFMAEFWELSDMNMCMEIFWLIYVSEQSTQICNSTGTYCGEMFFTSSVVCEGTLSYPLPWPKGLSQFFVSKLSKLQDKIV